MGLLNSVRGYFTRNISISDPALAEWLGINSAGMPIGDVSETRALGLTAFYRAVSLIAGTIASLPLKTYRTQEDGTRERAKSLFDNPAGPYSVTPFAWTEMVLTHSLIQGEAFLLHIRNAAGALVGLWPVHPRAVEKVEWSGFEKVCHVRMNDGSLKAMGQDEMTHIPALTTDGLRGVSPISSFRNALRVSLAGDIAAERMLSNGLLIAGLAVPKEDISADDAAEIKKGLAEKMQGVDKAGDIAVVNKALDFHPWTMSAEDAQFIAQRSFSVEEVARMFGVPPHLLGQTEKQTSWGTGVAEQNLGLARYTLMPWTSRIEQALSRLLPGSRFVEFDYAGLLQGTPTEEVGLLKTQIDAGILTVAEARRIRNLPPLESAARNENTNAEE